MKLVNKLKELSSLQEKIVSQYNELISETEKSLDINENEKLKSELKTLKEDLSSLEEKIQKINKENKNLRLELKEQIVDQKINILKVSQKRMELYFGVETGSQKNRLKAMENRFKFKIDGLRKKSEKELSGENLVIGRELNELEDRINTKIKEFRDKREAEEQAIQKEMLAGYNGLSDKSVPEEVVKKKIKQNKVEMKIGLFLLPAIGLFLVLIGLVILGYYNRENINDYVKGAAFFGGGILFLGLGEFLYRKRKETFATWLLGGGIAVLYAAVFFSYFVLKVDGNPIINLNIALILSVLITVASIVLSIRYNSKAVVSFGLIGGYLPFLSYIISFDFTGNAFYYGMVYLLLLNLAVLIISFWKGWRISNYLSFLLNVPSLCYLVFNAPNTWVGVGYSALVFAIYLAITLGYPLFNKKALNKALRVPDIILLALNTVGSAVVIYLLFDKLELDYLRGALALAFCLVYAGLGYFTNRVMEKEKGTIGLMFLTALTFAVLMIPFQFGRHWFTMGWLVEGILLTIYGYKKKLKPLEIGGWILTTLCAGGFFFVDFLVARVIEIYDPKLFDLKYTFIIAGITAIYAIYQWDIYKNRLSEYSTLGKLVKGFKFFLMVHLLIYILYMALTYYDQFIFDNKHIDQGTSGSVLSFFEIMIVSLIFLGYGFLLSKLKMIRDKAIKVFSVIFYIVGDLFAFGVLLFNPILENNILSFSKNSGVEYITVGILILLNVLILFNVKELILRAIRKTGGSLEQFPLWLGIVLTAIITGVVTRQLGLDEVSIVLGFSYLLIAFACVSYGFVRKFLYVRFYGLALILVALIILFLRVFIDASTPGKIITSIGFGLICLGLSFIYQLVNKNIEKITGRAENPAEVGKEG